MIDIENNAIIYMIDSENYEDIVQWLKKYPNIEVFSRTGSITYSSAIAHSHPNAIQVSDRFHILKNLTSYCKDYLSKYIKNKINICSTTNNSNINNKLSEYRKNKVPKLDKTKGKKHI